MVKAMTLCQNPFFRTDEDFGADSMHMLLANFTLRQPEAIQTRAKIFKSGQPVPAQVSLDAKIRHAAHYMVSS